MREQVASDTPSGSESDTPEQPERRERSISDLIGLIDDCEEEVRGLISSARAFSLGNHVRHGLWSDVAKHMNDLNVVLPEPGVGFVFECAHF